MDSGRADEYRDCAERVAREVLGEPNRQVSNGKGLRWGNHGSMSLNTERGLFYDHEQNEGGGVRWLLHHRLCLGDAEIDDWLKVRNYIKPRTCGDGQRKIVATYDYADEVGAVLFQVVRFDPKEFRQRRPDDKGDWIWSTKGVRQVPYRLTALVEAIADDRPIVIVEGEKDVNNLARWNVPATCNAGGAGKWRDELSEHFRGADAILIPDNDDAGYRHIQMVGAALTGVAKRIRVLMLPGLAPKADVSDWISTGGTVEQFWQLVETAPDWVKSGTGTEPCEADANPAKAQAAAGEQALIDELARLNQVDYDRRRTEAANELGIRRSTLDGAREARRTEMAAERGPAPLFGHWVVEPWDEPVGGDALLHAIVRRIRRHIVLGNEQATAVALWILMAWVHQEAAVHSPILLATSAEANSGKTTLINLVGFLVPRGMPCVEISEAALFRSIELYEPTVVVDEADTAFVENEALRAVVNSGWTRGSGVLRCIGDENAPHLFPTFCAKAIGMKGRKLPDTTLSRCIVIEMKRKKPSDRAEHFKHIDDAELSELRRQCMRWSIDNAEALNDIAPTMPAGFDNRLGDNWALMLGVADRIGGGWSGDARQAAVAISKVGEVASFTTQLLSDIREIFRASDDCDYDGNVLFACDRIASSELVDLLADMKDRPWPECRNGKPLTEAGLACLLKPFGVVPVQKQIDGARFRGYLRTNFEDAWERYLPLEI